MPKDISADVAYIGGVWAEGVLYGIHIVVFFTLCYIFTSRVYTRGREKSSRILLAYSTVMFILSTTHVSLAVSELLQGFVYKLNSTPGGPPVFYRINVFPQRKAIYLINTLLGDSLLIWRVYVIYGRNWIVCAPCFLVLLGTIACGLKTIVANGIFASSSVFDPSILNWVTATFVLTIITQISATILIAARIYAASQPFQVSGEVPDHGYGVGVAAGIGKGGGRKYERTQREKYMAMVWVVVESGAIYSSAAIVQLVTTLEKMNAGVIMEFLLSQLSAMVPMMIVVRVGLGLAYQGVSSTPYYDNRGGKLHYDDHDPSSSSPSSGGRRNHIGQLSTFQAASHQHRDGDNDNDNDNDDDHDHDHALKSMTLGNTTLSSGTKLDSSISIRLDSRVGMGDEVSSSSEKGGEKDGKNDVGMRSRGLVGGDDDIV